MQSGDDAIWMTRIQQQGDEGAFSKVYRKYSPLVLGIAIRMMRDQVEAEEILQTVFLNLWERAGDFDPSRGSLPVWLAVQCRSRCLDRLRSRGRRLRHEEPVAVMPEMPHNRPGALDSLELGQQRMLLTKALASLKPAQAEAIRAAYFDGMSRADIALQMRLPLGTVKTHLARGLAFMLELLKGQQEDLR
jgi:RNA polymerase sigma-70 factor (ECF subfamily)